MTVDTERILKAVIKHMQRNRIRMWTTVYVPGWYEIVYPEADRKDMEDLEPFLMRQAKTALNETLDRLNRPTLFERLLPWVFRRKPVEKTQEWRFDIVPSPAVPPGQMEVHHRVKVGKRMALSDDVTHVVMPGAGITTTVTVTTPAAGTTLPALAVLSWQSGSGARAWRMTKDEIVVGRGGLAEWVDCLIEASAQVSRQHLRIRRAPTGNGLEVLNQSANGTTLNGVPCPNQQWQGLPVPSELVLAGELSIRVEEPAE